MENNITIKRMTINDTFDVDELNTLFDEGTLWDAVEGEKFLNDENNALFIAFYEDKMAGFLSANKLQRFDKRKAEILLYEIGVKEEYRRLGLAKALIQTVKDWGKEQGADEVWVLTSKTNIPGNKLYQSEDGELEKPAYEMYVFKL